MLVISFNGPGERTPATTASGGAVGISNPRGYSAVNGAFNLAFLALFERGAYVTTVAAVGENGTGASLLAGAAALGSGVARAPATELGDSAVNRAWACVAGAHLGNRGARYTAVCGLLGDHTLLVLLAGATTDVAYPVTPRGNFAVLGATLDVGANLGLFEMGADVTAVSGM